MVNVKIATFNLRCLYDTVDGVQSFIHRAGMILDKIDSEEPQVIAFQEMTDRMRRFFDRHLPEYTRIGHGRGTDFKGEGVSIAFRKADWELLEVEQFWLSPTPYVPASRYECQSQYPRNCVTVSLKHKEMAVPVRFYAVHLDHRNEEARQCGVQQILKKVTENDQKYPCHTVILGDFNAEPESGAIALCNGYAAHPLTDVTAAVGPTFHDFGRQAGMKIDYIFVDRGLAGKVTEVRRWEEQKNGIFLSDHYPISCIIRFDS